MLFNATFNDISDLSSSYPYIFFNLQLCFKYSVADWNIHIQV
jgi:hypothetical protein